MWSAEVISKEFVNGLLVVKVRFTNGSQIFEEKFETRSGQDATWIRQAVKSRLDSLSGIETLMNTIPIGTVDTTTQTVEEQANLTAKQIYANKLAEFEKYVSAIRKGIISETNADFVAAKQWLKDNWSASYLDLL